MCCIYIFIWGGLAIKISFSIFFTFLFFSFSLFLFFSSLVLSFPLFFLSLLFLLVELVVSSGSISDSGDSLSFRTFRGVGGLVHWS